MKENDPNRVYIVKRARLIGREEETEVAAHDSAIGQHLLQNPTCASHYSDAQFSILSHGRTSFHLSALEATLIKSSKPALCRHKEFLYTLQLIH